MVRVLLVLAWLASVASSAEGVGTTTTTFLASSTTTFLASSTTTSTTSTTVPPTTTTTSTTETTSSTTTTSTITTTTSTTTLPPTTSTTSTTAPPTTTTTSTTETTSSTTTTSTTSTSTTTPSSTTSSTATSTSSTTTTSLAPVEVCDNCVDDDGDGLVDLEDPDCCVAPPAPLSISRLRLRSIGALTSIALDAAPLPAVPSLVPPTQTVLLQLAPDDAAPVLCASFDAVHFRSRRDTATFVDRTAGVPEADGIRSIRLTRLGTGALRLRLRGPRARFPMPSDTGHVRVTIGLRSLVTPGTPTRCVAQTVDVAPGKHGLTFP